MKCVVTYPSYEEANNRQLELLAEDIDALVSYVPTGWDQAYLGRNPIYALMVAEEQIDEAIDIIRLVADESHRHFYRCPKCGSGDVKECALDEGFGVGPFSLLFTLGLVAIGKTLMLRWRGRKFECRACHAVYRKKL
jgi:hypothetical protein